MLRIIYQKIFGKKPVMRKPSDHLLQYLENQNIDVSAIVDKLPDEMPFKEQNDIELEKIEDKKEPVASEEKSAATVTEEKKTTPTVEAKPEEPTLVQPQTPSPQITPVAEAAPQQPQVQPTAPAAVKLDSLSE